MDKTTQCKDILQYIQEHGSITGEEAHDMHIVRLGSRIFDLRKAGNPIVSTTVYKVGARGRTHFAVYTMGGT